MLGGPLRASVRARLGRQVLDRQRAGGRGPLAGREVHGAERARAWALGTVKDGQGGAVAVAGSAEIAHRALADGRAPGRAAPAELSVTAALTELALLSDRAAGASQARLGTRSTDNDIPGAMTAGSQSR